MGSFLSPAPETLGSAPGRAVPSSQARELGAVICVSVRGGGWMQFVKDPPRNPARAGLLEPQEPPGHPSLPSLPVPRIAAQGSKQGVRTPLLPLAPPRAGEAGWDHPVRHRVSSALPRVTQGLWGWLWSHMELPSTATPAQGTPCRCHSRGEDTVLGSLPHLHRGNNVRVTVMGSLPHLYGSPQCQGHCHTCVGDNDRVTVTPA